MNNEFIALYKNLMNKVRDEKYEKVKKEKVDFQQTELPNKEINTEQQLFMLKYLGFFDSSHFQSLPTNKQVSFLSLLLGKSDDYVRIALKNIENPVKSQSRYATFKNLEKLKLIFEYYEQGKVLEMLDKDIKKIKQ